MNMKLCSHVNIIGVSNSDGEMFYYCDQCGMNAEILEELGELDRE